MISSAINNQLNSHFSKYLKSKTNETIIENTSKNPIATEAFTKLILKEQQFK